MDNLADTAISIVVEEVVCVIEETFGEIIAKEIETDSETDEATNFDSCTPVPPAESDADGLSIGTLSLTPSCLAQEDAISESDPTPVNTPCDEPLVAEVRAMLSSKVNQLLTDNDCLRFLRARSLNVKKAADMITKWDEWWETPLPDTDILPGDITKNPDEQELVYTELMPHANLGESKTGCPIYWEKTGQISSIFQTIKTRLTENQLFVRHIRQQEVMVRRLGNASARHGRPIEKQVIVMDMKNVSMSLDFMALRVFKSTVVIDEACYPERLETLFMINAPFTFSVLWAMIKPWIDPVTVSKFKIIGANYQDALKEAIAEDQIPVEYGGTWEEFGWTYPKNIAQHDRMPHY